MIKLSKDSELGLFHKHLCVCSTIEKCILESRGNPLLMRECVQRQDLGLVLLAGGCTYLSSDKCFKLECMMLKCLKYIYLIFVWLSV